MTKGRFIALEGGEGAGKSTQARLLLDALRQRGLQAVATREPGGTPGAEAIRALLLDPPGEGWGAEAEALLFAAARADHVARLIVPSLDAGRWVVTDRFLDSSRAYQGAAGGIGDEAIRALHGIGSRGLRPDATLVLDLDTGPSTARLLARDGNRSDAIGGRDAGYHAKVRERFLAIANGDPTVHVIDADGRPDEVHGCIMKALAPLLDAR